MSLPSASGLARVCLLYLLYNAYSLPIVCLCRQAVIFTCSPEAAVVLEIVQPSSITL